MPIFIVTFNLRCIDLSNRRTFWIKYRLLQLLCKKMPAQLLTATDTFEVEHELRKADMEAVLKFKSGHVRHALPVAACF